MLMTELVVTTSSACTASAGPSRKLVFPAKVSPRPAFPLGSLLAGLSSCVDNSDRRRLVRYFISPRVCNRAAYCEALARGVSVGVKQPSGYCQTGLVAGQPGEQDLRRLEAYSFASRLEAQFCPSLLAGVACGMQFAYSLVMPLPFFFPYARCLSGHIWPIFLVDLRCRLVGHYNGLINLQ